MKYLGLFVFGVMLLSGCDYDDDAIVKRAKEIEKNRIAEKNKKTLKVLEEHIYEYNKTGIGRREAYNNPNKGISVIEFMAMNMFYMKTISERDMKLLVLPTKATAKDVKVKNE